MDESSCLFVSSRGILKSCDIKSQNPKSSCGDDFRYLDDVGSGSDGMSIYVCSELLSYFITEILPSIKNRFILVTGDSDLSMWHESVDEDAAQSLLNSELLIKWFGQNFPLLSHPKCEHIPIGLDYHTISNNPNHHWKVSGEGSSPLEQEKTLISIRQQMKPFWQRDGKIFANCFESFDRFDDRKSARYQIPPELIKIEYGPRTQTWNSISKSSFVLSPLGTGYDCHRTWESLCLGAIPIVRGNHFVKLFSDLPVLRVYRWSDINQNLLDKTIEEFREKEFNYQKLTLKWWTRTIGLGEFKPPIKS